MKKTIIIAGLALAVLASCNKEKVESGAPVTLSVAVSGEGQLTRADYDVQDIRLEAGETFNAYLTNCTRSEALFTMNADEVTATPNPQPFVMMERSAQVEAVYPATATKTTASWTVVADQTTDANYKACDLMYASAPIAASGRANITFQHRMAKIIVKATAGPGISEIRDIRIIKGFRTVNITGTTLMPGTTLADEIDATDFVNVLTGGTSGAVDCAALLPPQTVAAGTGTADRFLEVVTNKGTCWFNLRTTSGGSVTFESGKSYTLVLPVDTDIIGLTATITPWVRTADQVVFTEI